MRFISRHGEDLGSVFVGEIDGDQGAAGQIGFDHNRAEVRAGDDSVANGEGLLVTRAVERELGDQCGGCGRFGAPRLGAGAVSSDCASVSR